MTMINGAIIQNSAMYIARQPKLSSTRLDTSGVAATVTAITAERIDITPTTARWSYLSRKTAWARVGKLPAPIAWINRPIASIVRLSAVAQMPEPMTNKTRPTTTAGRRPYPSDSGPTINCTIAKPARNTPSSCCT